MGTSSTSRGRERVRRKRSRIDVRLTSARRLADRKRKHRSLQRKRQGLRRCQLWLSDGALEGLITQLIATNKLDDTTANDHHNVEVALAGLLERQGREWAR
jgi:uncharacterized protein YaiL (DUF2058 family)